MKRATCLTVLLFLCAAPRASADRFKTPEGLARLNSEISGRVIDYSANHGADNRIWSAALGEWRDLYVYVPPGFDPCRPYPVALYLHGYPQDETTFLEPLVEHFDEVIRCGKCPRLIIAFPDGSIKGRPSFHDCASFFANSRAGNFEDFLLQDVWGFLLAHYPIRPERGAHFLIGSSMGGCAAYRLAITHRDCFASVIGFLPALNLRWVDCHDRYKGPFDPCCWGWRTRLRPHEPVGRFYGVVTVRFGTLVGPLFGRGPDALPNVARINPIELLDACDVRPGEVNMFIAYAGRDEFNIMAHVESFLAVARRRGLCVAVVYDPEGRHRLETGLKMFPDAIAWMAPLLAPWSPCR